MMSLQDQPERSCATVDEVARARLAEIEQRIASLTVLKTELERMSASCAHGQMVERRIIEAVADHGLCQHH